jgi:hypothetical protein
MFRPLFRRAGHARYSHDYALTPLETAPHRALRLPVRRLSTIGNSLGHESVDLVKMDVEGAEYAVIDDLLASGFPCDQLLVEFHHFWDGSLDRTRDCLDRLDAAGWRLYHVSETGREFSFAHDRALNAARKVPRAALVRRGPAAEIGHPEPDARG